MNDLAVIPEWRDIPGYEGLYAVTRDGRVWAHPKTWVTGKGRGVVHSRPGTWRRLQVSRGYMCVELARHRDAKLLGVHRLVGLAWIPNPLALPQINHINGVKSDNRVENLEWCTASANTKHAFATGLICVDDKYRATLRRNSLASSAKTRKLSMKQASEIRGRYAQGETQTALAGAFGVHQSTIWKILQGHHYAI